MLYNIIKVNFLGINFKIGIISQILVVFLENLKIWNVENGVYKDAHQ